MIVDAVRAKREIERADPTVAIGTLLEAAILVRVTLFDADPTVRAHHQGR